MSTAQAESARWQRQRTVATFERRMPNVAIHKRTRPLIYDFASAWSDNDHSWYIHNTIYATRWHA